MTLSKMTLYRMALRRIGRLGLLFFYLKSRSAEFHSTDCHYADDYNSAIFLSVKHETALCHSAEYNSAKCNSS